ncbi:hypothetical protein GTQ43_09645 [Nostoc sp. KVJ3]|uniref:hypothetical protein n=1 Tax=Nostoc sp. KVJ3 TaxID=457945 RepID=UPI002236FDC4|nr:hypothetical protein [Nostoc sp. KVJ3]MCW5314056.1 hypothetical protein [Nostoc sp. KVJ3]
MSSDSESYAQGLDELILQELSVLSQRDSESYAQGLDELLSRLRGLPPQVWLGIKLYQLKNAFSVRLSAKRVSFGITAPEPPHIIV